MTEFEILIRTRPPLTNFTTETLKDNSGLVIRLCPKIQLSSSSSSPPSSMRMQHQFPNMDPLTEDIETCGGGVMIDTDLEDEEDFCNDSVFGSTTTSSLPSPMSSHTKPTSCASSTPIAIPTNPGNHQSSPSSLSSSHRRLSSGSGSTPPHHNSYLMRVSPWAPVELSNSPTSSGYSSSSPRLLTASTQTPPMFTFDVRLRFRNSSDNSPIHRSPSTDLRRERLRRQTLQTSGSERRPRYHSEGSGTDAVQAAEDESEDPSNPSQGPLPDLVNNTAFRPRANTEPSRPRPEIAVGEQLRRISDEFHVSYEEIRNLRRRRQNQGWLSRVIERFRGRPHHDDVAEEQPQAAEAAPNMKHVRQNLQ